MEEYIIEHYLTVWEMQNVEPEDIWSDKERAAFEAIEEQVLMKELDERELIESKMLTSEEWWAEEEDMI